MLNSKKILITGASGFIGTNLLEYYKADNKVLNVDIDPPRNKQHNQYWQKVDIRNQTTLSNAVKMFQPDYIVHLAARTDLEGKSQADYDSNTVGTKNLIQIINRSDSIKRVILASSMLVNKVGSNPKDVYHYNPTTVYGESKVEMEKIILNTRLKPEWLIIRPTSIWGPWFDAPYKNFFDAVLKGYYFNMKTKACTKTYGYIGNSVIQIDKLLRAPSQDIVEKIFYIGDNPPIYIPKWADEIQLAYSDKKNKVLNFYIFQLSAYVGDFLKLFNVNFPMTSFRLKNMTTDNIINLDDLYKIVSDNAFSRSEGIDKTLTWIKEVHI